MKNLKNLNNFLVGKDSVGGHFYQDLLTKLNLCSVWIRGTAFVKADAIGTNVVDLGCLSRVPDRIFSILDRGSRGDKFPDPHPRICIFLTPKIDTHY
jgi:hypothetical protein